MSMILFALIGAELEAGLTYWLCFIAYCTIRVSKAVSEAIKEKI